ncbi:MAG TPA: hypothetical protein VII47_10160 [Actinomycetota bacterium]
MSMQEFGETEFGETEFGEMEYGETEFGEAEYGEMELGEAEFGETEFGETEFGETEYGEAEQFLGGIGNVLGGLFGEVGESPLSEAQEVELATELLELSSEQELEQFLGNVFKGISRAVGGFIRSPVGRALGGALKGIARKALPMVGGALGSFVAPGIGTALGSRLGSMASRLFEVELGEMSNEQAEFEVARKLVNLAATAAQHAALAPPTANPQAVAKMALVKAAQAHAPGIARALSGAGAAPCPPCPKPAGYGRPAGRLAGPGAAAFGAPSARAAGAARAAGLGAAGLGAAGVRHVPSGNGHGGRWIRRGNKIVVLGA